MAAAEEVMLLDLGGDDEALERRKAGAHLEGAGSLFGDFDVEHHLVSGAALLLGDVDALEVPELGYERLALLDLALVVEVALADPELTSNDGVSGLGDHADESGQG